MCGVTQELTLRGGVRTCPTSCMSWILRAWHPPGQGTTRAAQIMTLAICHITKRGEIAGPKAIEHAVDCSILIRKAYNRRMVSVLKNRFGPETARPLQLEIDPISLKLRVSPHSEILPAVARGYLPAGGITEVQGAVMLPKPGAAARITAPGLPRKEIEQYVTGLCQVPGFELADFDLSIQCRVPGEMQYRSVMGLPLCMALAASYIQRPILDSHLFLGEIDLCRKVRDVPAALLNDLANAGAHRSRAMGTDRWRYAFVDRQCQCRGALRIGEMKIKSFFPAKAHLTESMPVSGSFGNAQPTVKMNNCPFG